jgi:hypothetical protein
MALAEWRKTAVGIREEDGSSSVGSQEERRNPEIVERR